jgi:hypothetical protein
LNEQNLHFLLKIIPKGDQARGWTMASLALAPERTAAKPLKPHGTVPAKSTSGIKNPVIFNHAPNFLTLRKDFS